MTADELKGWMTRNGYSVRGLARDLGLSPTTITYYRSGKRPVPRTFALALDTLELRRQA